MRPSILELGLGGYRHRKESQGKEKAADSIQATSDPDAEGPRLRHDRRR